MITFEGTTDEYRYKFTDIEKNAVRVYDIKNGLVIDGLVQSITADNSHPYLMDMSISPTSKFYRFSGHITIVLRKITGVKS